MFLLPENYHTKKLVLVIALMTDIQQKKVDETDSPDNTTAISYPTTAISSTLFHDSTQPLTTNSGHCLENDAGSQLEDADKAICHPLWLK
jgi:hypothetical protein